MKYTTIPHADIRVSKICLGTMTWGNQNTPAEGFEQMDYALDAGVNFFDTAELYPVPATADTYADTERIMGDWFASRKNRDKVVLATKIAGPGAYTAHIRTTGFTPDSIGEALEGSLKRLQTDYIDLYQLHWPERNANFFGKRDYFPDSTPNAKGEYASNPNCSRWATSASPTSKVRVLNESGFCMVFIRGNSFCSAKAMYFIEAQGVSFDKPICLILPCCTNRWSVSKIS